jgi:hypothetical protein
MGPLPDPEEAQRMRRRQRKVASDGKTDRKVASEQLERKLWSKERRRDSQRGEAGRPDLVGFAREPEMEKEGRGAEAEAAKGSPP